MTETIQNEKSIDEPTLTKRYELLIKARNFHYANYNKWMTYFYLAVSALFLAFFTIASKTNEEVRNKQLIEISLLLLGYIVSLLWFWSSKGYYYWNINFISLINHYEEKIFKWNPDKRVYYVFYDKTSQNDYGSSISGANISTSKIAILYAWITTNFWGFLLFFSCLSSCDCSQFIIIIASILLSIFIVHICSLIIPKYFLYSKIDEMPQIKS